MKSMSYEIPAKDLGYLAGLIDGEGWIGIHRRKRSWKRDPSRTHYLRPCIVIGMAKRECVDHVANMLRINAFNVTIVFEGDTFRVRMYPSLLRWLLPQLLPHLILKRRQAEILLEFISTPPWNGRELTTEEMLRRTLLHEEIVRLNERPAQTRRRLLEVQ